MRRLSDRALAEIETARREEDSARHALLTALRVVQEERRQVGPDEVVQIAALLSLSPATVEGVARFYDQISEEATGRQVLSLCRGISCQLCGADPLAREVLDNLGIEDGGRTQDGSLTVRLVECIGNCDQAPTGMLDTAFVGPLTSTVLSELLTRWRR